MNSLPEHNHTIFANVNHSLAVGNLNLLLIGADVAKERRVLLRVAVEDDVVRAVARNLTQLKANVVALKHVDDDNGRAANEYSDFADKLHHSAAPIEAQVH